MALFKRKRVRDYLEEADIKLSDVKEEAVEKKPEPSVFEKLSGSLKKTKSSILSKLGSIVFSGRMDDDTLEALEEALYTSDIGVKTTERIIGEVRKRSSKGEDINDVKKLVYDVIISMLDKSSGPVQVTAKPHVILVVGVNGNGKTTTIGKLAHYYMNMGKRVLIGAADTFRAAAIEQLEEWAKRTGADFIKNQPNSDPAAVAYDSYKAGEARGADIVLIDTAGRLHNKVNLMNELEKISRVLKKLNPDAPHEVLLVLDATTGQNALSQAKQFSKTSGVTGIVLSKLDGTAKGGVTIAINQEMDIPVRFIGIGEKKEDLQLFDPEVFVRSIFE
ncbi:MAG: signal recognition particle-docking protein FtsY [Candidatus Delongbacteria bacterium]|nr:signal recognition particle-docking protein FtsY [Candidatus Delongbacteria bacterium]